MAILNGQFRVEVPKNNLKNMKPKTHGYILARSGFLGKRYFSIPWATEVFYKIEDVIALGETFVGVYRKCKGNSPQCFDIFLDVDSKFDVESFYLYDDAKMFSLLKDSYNYLTFKNPPIFFDKVDTMEDMFSFDENFLDNGGFLQINDEDQDSKMLLDMRKNNPTLKELKEMLEEAVANEEYLKAAELFKRIKKRKNNSS